jgi:hypothetical protein
MPPSDNLIRVDAKSFQEPLALLAETMVQQVFREGQSHCGMPGNMHDDITMMLRYALSIYRLLFYLNADVRRQKDTDWHVEYGVSAMPLIRSLIDCLYNITLFLDNPAKAAEYRKCGLKKVLGGLDAERNAHPGDPAWEAWRAERLPFIESFIVGCGFTVADVRAQGKWQTMVHTWELRDQAVRSRPISSFLIDSPICNGNNIRLCPMPGMKDLQGC